LSTNWWVEAGLEALEAGQIRASSL